MKANLIFCFGICLCLVSCDKVEKDFSIKKDGDIRFWNSGIELKFDQHMYCQVYKRDASLTFIPENGEEALSRPSHFIVIDGEELRDFRVDYNSIAVESIKTEFGSGRKMELSGFALCSDGTQISKTLSRSCMTLIRMLRSAQHLIKTWGNHKKSLRRITALIMSWMLPW